MVFNCPRNLNFIACQTPDFWIGSMTIHVCTVIHHADTYVAGNRRRRVPRLHVPNACSAIHQLRSRARWKASTDVQRTVLSGKLLQGGTTRFLKKRARSSSLRPFFRSFRICALVSHLAANSKMSPVPITFGPFTVAKVCIKSLLFLVRSIN